MGVLAMLVFLVLVGLGIWSGYDPKEQTFTLKKVKVLLIVGGVVASYIISSFVIVEQGDKGAIFNIFTGVSSRNLDSGMTFVPAIINKVEIYDVYTRTYTEEINCLSKDGLPVGMDVSIRFRLNGNVSEIFRNVGTERDVEEKILIPTVRSKMRDVAAMYTAQQAYALQRMEMQAMYEKTLNDLFEKEKYLVSEQILIRKVTPPADLISKIQETKVSEQEVINQQNKLIAERIIKDQTIVKAQAESESLKIKGGSITNNPKILALEWINKWNGTLPNYMMGNSNGIMFNLGDLK